MDICVAIPLRNAEYWLLNFHPIDEYEYVFFDNASNDGTRNVLIEKGFNFDHSDIELSRPDSWIRAYSFAAKQNKKWIKPLFVGDELYTGLSDELSKFSSADVVLFPYQIRGPLGFTRIARTWELSGNLLLDVAISGPFAGPPLAIAFTQSAFLQIENLNTMTFSSWLADFQLFLVLANKNRYFSSRHVVGVFNIRSRRTFSKLRSDPNSLREELDLMVRYRSQLNNFSFVDQLRSSLRILDLSLHRFPNFEVIPLSLRALRQVWK